MQEGIGAKGKLIRKQMYYKSILSSVNKIFPLLTIVVCPGFNIFVRKQACDGVLLLHKITIVSKQTALK